MESYLGDFIDIFVQTEVNILTKFEYILDIVLFLGRKIFSHVCDLQIFKSFVSTSAQIFRSYKSSTKSIVKISLDQI